MCVCSLYLLSMGLVAQQILAMFIAYNVLAFLTQPLTGALADRMRQRHWLLLASVLLLTLAVLATVAVPRFGLVAEGTMLVAAMLGMGNSLFHVWGGKQVAITTRNDIRALGMFVSTGVLGLSLGYVLFSWTLLCLFLLAISVLAVAYLHGEASVCCRDNAQLTALNYNGPVAADGCGRASLLRWPGLLVGGLCRGRPCSSPPGASCCHGVHAWQDVGGMWWRTPTRSAIPSAQALSPR